MAVRSFEDLEVWQLAKQLAIAIYKVTVNFPSEERFGLTPQLRSAAVSISANIAEGFGRHHYKDSLKFLYNGRGSLLEVKSHLLIAKELKLITNQEFETFSREVKNLGVKLNNFINSLKKRSNS